jgi:hypothetical protein
VRRRYSCELWWFCAALAAGIWVYRKSYRFAVYASIPNVSRPHAKNLHATGGGDSRFGPIRSPSFPFTNVAKFFSQRGRKTHL